MEQLPVTMSSRAFCGVGRPATNAVGRLARSSPSAEERKRITASHIEHLRSDVGETDFEKVEKRGIAYESEVRSRERFRWMQRRRRARRAKPARSESLIEAVSMRARVYSLPSLMTMPAPSRKLSWRLLRPSGILVMKYSACMGRTETCLVTLKSMPPPAMPARHRLPVRSVLARFFRRQIAGLFDFIEIQPAGRKLRYLPAVAGGEGHVEDLCPHHAANCAFIHGEEVAAHPVPTFEIVRIVDADLHFQLGLSPEARAVRRRQSHSGIKVPKLELAVAAIQIHSGLVVRIFLKIVIRLQLKAHFFRVGHLVGGVELQPLAAGADAVLFALVRRHGASLGASQCCRTKPKR